MQRPVARFENRRIAGQRLAHRLAGIPRAGLVVLGLPRGGVPVAYEVARALGAPLDVILVRKLGVPSQPELAMGAIGEDGVRVVNDEVARYVSVGERDFAAVEARERVELERRARLFRGGRVRESLVGRTALIVDDGIATGSTVRAACRVARAHGAAQVIVATPVAPPRTTARLQNDADEVVVLESPEHFLAIGEFYADFTQTTDDEVVDLLARERAQRVGEAMASPAARGDVEEAVEVPAGTVALAGDLRMPAGSRSVVLFAHGSGSSRTSPRNRAVAGVLQQAGMGTLLFDLLTPAEARDRANVFDIGLLADRLGAATAWVLNRFPDVVIGYFGASTGAAAALWAASEPGATVGAVVSRGGRPDLAGPRLAAVRAPTLLVVGGDDDVVLDLNRQAQARMRCETALAVVPGATHLFEEPGTLERAADLARDWFVGHLR